MASSLGVGCSPAASGNHAVVRESRLSPRLVAATVALALSLASVIPAHSQEPPHGSDRIPAEIREHYVEIIRAQAALVRIPQMIMQDENLKAQHLAFEKALIEAMATRDAETTRRLERVEELQRRAAGSPGGQDALLEEGRRLRDDLLATADEVLSQPAVAAAARPLVASLTAAFERIEGFGPKTRSIVADEELVLKSVTAMTVFGR